LDAVADRLLYLDEIGQTKTAREMRLAIDAFRTGLAVKKAWVNLPM